VQVEVTPIAGLPSTKMGLGKIAKLINFGNTGRSDSIPVGGRRVAQK